MVKKTGHITLAPVLLTHPVAWWFVLLAVFLATACDPDRGAPSLTKSNTGPYLMKMEHLELIRSLSDHDPVLRGEVEMMITGADSLLGVEFTYVTGKQHIPPSGDIHDYMSLHRYSYPDSEGNYTIIRDGQTNPEIYEYDGPQLSRLSGAAYTLAFAYYYSGGENKYAAKASEIIYNWFLNPETRMNPNMTYAQVRPGIQGSGGGQGIIGANNFIKIIEAASILYDSPHWTPDHHLELKHWFYDFFRWIMEFYHPKEAYRSLNISTWLDVQRAMYLLFTEQEGRLNSDFYLNPVADRMVDQIESDGYQPAEAGRGIPQHYVYFNLSAYMNLSLLRKNLYERTGFDRDWEILKDCALNECEQGGLKAALDDIADFILDADKTPLFGVQQDFNRCNYLEIFRPGALAFEKRKYEDVVEHLLLNEGCRHPDVLLAYPSIYDVAN